MDENRRTGETDDSPAGDTATMQDSAAQLAELTAERDRLAAENAELQDRFLRSRAEFENFRRRSEREKAGVIEYAEGEAVRKILPVVDDFERALKQETSDRDYARGIELIYQHLMEALQRVGLEPIESTGKAFDPNLHHAIESVPSEEVDDHTVLDELQKGYNFRGKLLRPAMVRVAVRP